MLTRSQKDDLRFVHDCLLAAGDKVSESYVQWLAGLNPRLASLLPAAPKARRLFLPHAIELVLKAADGPCEAREQIQDFGRLLAALEVAPTQFAAAEQRLLHALAEQFGSVYSDRLRQTCMVAVASASFWLHDGMLEVHGEAVGEQLSA
jgi:hypothetical protein